MKLKILAAMAVAAAALALPRGADALTMDQFIAICDSHPGECRDHPILQAYVGGALDLIAMLDEETDHLAKVYCREPSELFDVPAIIDYMVEHRAEYADRNAMLPVIRFLEENGGC